MTEPGILYIVGTPIGNLGDFSPRAKETLSAVDFIAAEDTRVTRKLLTAFGLSKPLISCHEHNITQRASEIMDRLTAGESGAIVTDAGMPCISDPGQQLVRLLHEHNMKIALVPGPTAALSALAASGLPTDRFYFLGFLPREAKERRKALQEVSSCPATLIFYEAPHRLVKTLEDFLAVLGDREISVARELTKKFEEIRLTTVSQALSHYRNIPPKGEFVLLVRGSKKTDDQPMTPEEAMELCHQYLKEGLSPAKAAAKAAAAAGIRKSVLYARLLEEKQIEQGQQ